MLIVVLTSVAHCVSVVLGLGRAVLNPEFAAETSVGRNAGTDAAGGVLAILGTVVSIAGFGWLLSLRMRGQVPSFSHFELVMFVILSGTGVTIVVEYSFLSRSAPLMSTIAAMTGMRSDSMFPSFQAMLATCVSLVVGIRYSVALALVGTNLLFWLAVNIAGSVTGAYEFTSFSVILQVIYFIFSVLFTSVIRGKESVDLKMYAASWQVSQTHDRMEVLEPSFGDALTR